MDRSRLRLVYRGTVQGVGFRPTVYRAAVSLSLSGFVQNRRSEVVVEVEGEAQAVQRFTRLLSESLPPAARVEGIQELELPPSNGRGDPNLGFQILESAHSEYNSPPIPPDLAICGDCARELLDPSDRRYLYPFITCTQCGPRYSIVERTPFDRNTTSMGEFTQCPDCLREFSDPGNRRFQSQTNSCPSCGPRLRAANPHGEEVPGDPLALAVRALNRGEVVALQGLGGFHLAADPSQSRAMERLRMAKDREKKPFALMVKNLEEARSICELSDAEEQALVSAESPIVIAMKRREAPPHFHGVSETGTLGILLPYTPLHFLLFHHPDAPLRSPALVMTSGNRAGEPISADLPRALGKLSDTADLFLHHDRRIVFRSDDSIVRVGHNSPPFLMRRSRGYVPRLVSLEEPVRGAILGIGGDLKSAPALARGRDVHLSPFLGDLDEEESMDWFKSEVKELLDINGGKVGLVVHDLHPLYRSTMWAERQGFGQRIAIQHHFAHILSVMAEHGLEEAIGLSFDGTGYGTDGTIWGGEFLRATRSGFSRLGSFRPFPLPGGEAAVLHPPRIALAMLSDPTRKSLAPVPSIPGLTPEERQIVLAMVEKGLNTPLTSSLGRIFDAAAAILGLLERTSYEGEGPMLLEGAALSELSGKSRAGDFPAARELLPFSEARCGGHFLIDAAPLLSYLLQERERKNVGELALAFHLLMARASLSGAERMRDLTGIMDIALSGGVFQNLHLRELLVPLLTEQGFRVFLNRAVPPGDGGLSLGQVYYVP